MSSYLSQGGPSCVPVAVSGSLPFPFQGADF